MTTAHDFSAIPEWDLADRMRKTLRTSGESVQDCADYFGVSRNTVGSWINGHVVPSTTTLRLWAMRYGVPLTWLQTGLVPPPGDGLSPLDRRYGHAAGSARLVRFRPPVAAATAA